MIYKTITDDYEFWDWIKNSGSYSNNFSFEGAKALQAYLDELSDDSGENIEFDPISWCCEYSEYDNALQAYNEYHGVDDKGVGTSTDDDNTPENANAQALEWLQDNTAVIELDNGGIIVQEF